MKIQSILIFVFLLGVEAGRKPPLRKNGRLMMPNYIPKEIKVSTNKTSTNTYSFDFDDNENKRASGSASASATYYDCAEDDYVCKALKRPEPRAFAVERNRVRILPDRTIGISIGNAEAIGGDVATASVEGTVVLRDRVQKAFSANQGHTTTQKIHAYYPSYKISYPKLYPYYPKPYPYYYHPKQPFHPIKPCYLHPYLCAPTPPAPAPAPPAPAPPAPSPYPTPAPTPYPTPAPTPYPTPAPTPYPTPSPPHGGMYP